MQKNIKILTSIAAVMVVLAGGLKEPVVVNAETKSVVASTLPVATKSVVTKPVVKETSINVNTLVYSSAAYGTLKWNGAKVLLYRDHGNGSTYDVYNYSSGKNAYSVRASDINIAKDPATDTNSLTAAEIAQYANDPKHTWFTSKTPYCLWTDLARQKVYVLVGSKGHWRCAYSLACASGINKTPTPRGTFHVAGKEYTVTASDGEIAHYGTEFIGRDYLFHGVPSLHGVVDNTLGKRASHGCVRLSVSNALYIYNNLAAGTTIWIN